MEAVTKTIEFEFLKRDFRQVAVGYIVACIGMTLFGVKAAKLENKLSRIESENEELKNSNKELLKSMQELHVELAKTQLQSNS